MATATILPEQFAMTIRRVANELVAVYHAENHKEASRKLKSFPIRRLRENYVDLVEGKPASPDTIRNHKAGIASAIGNRHAAFHALDWGRRRYSTGRLGGTSKASRGMTKPTTEHLQNPFVQAKIRSKAIAAASKRLKA